MDIHIDRIDNLAAGEERGAIRWLVRKVRVKFTKAELDQGGRDFNVLNGALKQLDIAGMAALSVLGNIRNADDRFAPLVLVKRDPQIAEGEPTLVDVILRYEHVMDGPNQQLMKPKYGYIYGKGRTSIVQKTSNFFYPYGVRTPIADPDNPGSTKLPQKQLITVSHQFPTWETGIAAAPTDPDFPRVILQGGEVELPYPQSNYNMEGMIRTNAPRKLARQVVACVNVAEWQGDPPLTWICSEAQYEVNDPGESKADGLTSYRFRFEFQYNVDTWDPTVVFIDQRTGRPPADVEIADTADANGVVRLYSDPTKVPGDPTKFRPAGMWNVPALTRIDFDKFFGALFDGSLPPGVL